MEIIGRAEKWIRRNSSLRPGQPRSPAHQRGLGMAGYLAIVAIAGIAAAGLYFLYGKTQHNQTKSAGSTAAAPATDSGAGQDATNSAPMAAPAAGAAHELIDVASFFNGGYYYAYKMYSVNREMGQLRAISHGRVRNTLNNDDGDQELTIAYSLAAPATIETFRIAGEHRDVDLMPHRIEFAVSQSPNTGFQTVAAYRVPESYLTASSANYDFSIPAAQKISGRYVRITMSGAKYGIYYFTRFSAYGRFDQPAELRQDFSGIYRTYGDKDEAASQADLDMISQQEKTAFNPYLILQQKDGYISGCYVYATSNGGGGLGIGGDKGLLLSEISEVLGTVTGGIENNVFRFTRTSAKDGSQSQGVMALLPVAEGINKGSSYAGYLRITEDASSSSKGGASAFAAVLSRFSNTPVPCAVAGQKEKTAVETMQESLEKTGKVQLYGINFDFDSDTLRPESHAVLDEVAALAQANPAWKFEIGGHTDSLGSADYNLKLSDRRAASVMRYLTGKGVDAARLQSKGYGFTRPLVPETEGGDSARAQNRRVELVRQP